MIIGTFLESYYGTEFANRVLYKSFFFFAVQVALFLSIIFAAVLRLPPKKRLYGFYTIHAGLVIIGLGSLITYIAGIDGQVTLLQNQKNHKVQLSEDIFRMTYPDEGKQVIKILPKNVFETNLDVTLENIKIKKYIPFADGKLDWVEGIYNYDSTEPVQSTLYHFQNNYSEEDFVMSLHPEASHDFTDQKVLGPLKLIYVHAYIETCFSHMQKSKILYWNIKKKECFFKEAMPKDFKESSEWKNISLNEIEKSPSLILFGKKLAFFDKDIMNWKILEFPADNKSISLPWMNSKISLIEHVTEKIPFYTPVATLPIQKNGTLENGGIRAVQIEVLGRQFWISNENPLALNIEGKDILFEVTKKNLNLPFELELTQFKMEKNPGTNIPATFESYVKLNFKDNISNHHVYMNNPLKVKDFTFYQASYRQENDKKFSSTFTVNIDQGRPLKYLGSLMLVLGSIWHFKLNKKKKENFA
jgi:hypothetical protein